MEHLQNSQDLAKSRYVQASANLRETMIDSERRHALVLRAWEATNIERDLRAIMGAVAEVLAPHVPIDGMGLVVWSGTVPIGAPRLLDIHVGAGIPNETVDEILRESSKPVSTPADRPIVPHDEALYRDMQEGVPYMCADLLAKPTGIRMNITWPQEAFGRTRRYQ